MCVCLTRFFFRIPNFTRLLSSLVTPPHIPFLLVHEHLPLVCAPRRRHAAASDYPPSLAAPCRGMFVRSYYGVIPQSHASSIRRETIRPTSSRKQEYSFCQKDCHLLNQHKKSVFHPRPPFRGSPLLSSVGRLSWVCPSTPKDILPIAVHIRGPEMGPVDHGSWIAQTKRDRKSVGVRDGISMIPTTIS